MGKKNESNGTAVAPLKARPTLSDTVLEATDLVVTGLENIGSLSGVPFVAQAASLMLMILKTVQSVKDNKEAYGYLVSDAYRLVCTAADVCKRYKEEGKELSSDLYIDLAKLVATLGEIQKYSTKKVKRSIAERILFKRQDLDDIKHYREELKQALDTFNLESTVAIRQGVEQLGRSQTQILHHLEMRQQVEGEGGAWDETATATTLQETIVDDDAHARAERRRQRRERQKRERESPISNLLLERPHSASGVAQLSPADTSFSSSASLSSSRRPASMGESPTVYNPLPATVLDPQTTRALESLGGSISNSVGKIVAKAGRVHVYDSDEPYSGSHVVSIGSGTTTTTVVSNSNNDYSNNVYGLGPNQEFGRRGRNRHMVGPYRQHHDW